MRPGARCRSDPAGVSAEGYQTTARRDFVYAPRPVLELLSVRDSIHDGSVAVHLGVRAFEPGLYVFEANLMSGDGTFPIAYSKLSYQLDPANLVSVG